MCLGADESRTREFESRTVILDSLPKSIYLVHCRDFHYCSTITCDDEDEVAADSGGAGDSDDEDSDVEKGANTYVAEKGVAGIWGLK